ncbi:hypothetical protein ABT024_21330 [Streptomyces sp. NPDC002812]|uniref:hypothetical protein n=1 Tax=Streptomyces sp. NPDC002812 TaxID=3154434 RepID=UPI00331B0A6E
MESSELGAMVVRSFLTTLATGTATAAVDGGNAALSTLVRTRMAASPRGQAALTALEADADDAAAQAEAQAVLTEEIAADPELRHQLTLRFESHRGSMVITNSRARGNFSLGPLTVNNTAGGRVLAAVVVLLVVAVVALALYGTRQLLIQNDSPRSGSADGQAVPVPGGGKPGEHQLTATETTLALPPPDTLPRDQIWSYFAHHGVVDQPDGCRADQAEYEVSGRDEPEHVLRLAYFGVYACPSKAAASAALPKIVAGFGQEESPESSAALDLPKAGDESAARIYGTSASGTLVYVIRSGNALVRFAYDIYDPATASKEKDETEVVNKARMALERLRSVQAGTLTK